MGTIVAAIGWVVLEKREDPDGPIKIQDGTKFMDAVATTCTVISAGRRDGSLTAEQWQPGSVVLAQLIGSVRIRHEGKLYYAVRDSMVVGQLIEGVSA